MYLPRIARRYLIFNLNINEHFTRDANERYADDNLSHSTAKKVKQQENSGCNEVERMCERKDRGINRE